MMKTTLCALLLVFSLSARAQAVGLPSVPVVTAEFHSIYVPGGFDSNDRVQIVGEGVFANTCYRPAPPVVVIQRAAREIHVTSSAFKYEGNCLEVQVAFDQTLDLGILDAGTYRVIQDLGEARKEMGTLQIGVSRSTDADAFLYAPVSQAYAENRSGKTFVRVTGSFTDSCMNLSDVKITNEPRVLVVQPVASRIERSDCAAGNFPFDRSVEVRGAHQGRYLLHVRSLNGNAFNHLLDLN